VKIRQQTQFLCLPPNRVVSVTNRLLCRVFSCDAAEHHNVYECIAADTVTGVKEVKATLKVSDTETSVTMPRNDGANKITQERGDMVSFQGSLDTDAVKNGKGTLMITAEDYQGNKVSEEITNVIVKNIIVSSMQGIFKAKTDISKVDFKFFNSYLNIKGLAQANKDSPMKNIFQADDIMIDFDLADLCKGKFHAENIIVEGVALNTDRKVSGKIALKEKKTKQKSEESDISKKSEELKNSVSEHFMAMFQNYNPERILADLQEQLESPKIADDISAGIQEKITKWQDTPAKIQAEINEAYQKLETDRKALLDEFDKNGKSAEYDAINRRIQEREVERANLEERLLRINNHEYDGVKKDTINKSVPFFVGGIVVILATLIISGVLFSLQQGCRKINK